MRNFTPQIMKMTAMILLILRDQTEMKMVSAALNEKALSHSKGLDLLE